MTPEEYNNRNPADDIIDTKTPYDELVDNEEPNLNQNHYREASRHFYRVITMAMSFILDGGPDMQNRMLGVIYALELFDIVDGKSQREMARELGLSSGTISRNTIAFKRLAGL